MITENVVLMELRLGLGDIMFDTQPSDYYIEIIKKKTLHTWSKWFPKIVKRILITADCGIEVKHPQTGAITRTYMYRVPKEDPSDEYINYEFVYHPGNLVLNQASSNLPITNGLLGMVSSALPNNQYFGKIRYSFGFISPDIITVEPILMKHMDFTVNMQRLCRIKEIPEYYRDEFIELCLADVSYALYNKYKHLKNGASFQGLEINVDMISDLKEIADTRKELIEKFNANYFKNPDRFESIMEFTQFT